MNEPRLQGSDMIRAMNDAINAAAWDLARQREDAVREAARSYLPRGLKRLVNHPRLLWVVYRVRPSWRPRIVTGADGISVGRASALINGVVGKDGTIYVTETFYIERDR